MVYKNVHLKYMVYENVHLKYVVYEKVHLKYVVYEKVHLKYVVYEFCFLLMYMVYENSLLNFPSEIHGYFHKPFSQTI